MWRRGCGRDAAAGIHLRDEALVDAKDLVCVVAAQPEEAQDVRDGDGRGCRVEAEYNLAVALDLDLDL